MRYLVSALVGVVPMLFGYLVWHYVWGPETVGTAWIEPTEGQARLEGQQLYNTYCASCHGLNLQGQPNWRQRLGNGRLPAPPHDATGHTWHHPDAQLIEMIKVGFVGGVNAPTGYESDMPAFGSVLSEQQIIAILGYIKSSWPDTALSAQKEISLNR